jgi:hypothetical protein
MNLTWTTRVDMGPVELDSVQAGSVEPAFAAPPTPNRRQNILKSGTFA